MTVSIDPSEVRQQATVQRRRLRLPLRTMLLGGLGGAGLLAFTIGAFSFFSGLADPRVRPLRAAVVASKMPDLKDGLPALVSEDGAPAPTATVMNLAKPALAEAVAAPAEIEPAPRVELAVASEPTAPPAPPAAEATGSVARPKSAPGRAKAGPTIENVASVSTDTRPVPLIAPARTAGPLAPAKAETVRAKPVAVAALPSETESAPPVPAAAPKRAAVQDVAAEPKPAPAKKPAQKVARAKAKSVAEASVEPEAASAPPPAPEEEGFTSKVSRGIKTIEGLFGQD